MNTANDTDSPFVQLTVAQEFAQLISNIITKELDFVAHESIEILHDFRVDLRKLRTWLKIMDIAGYPAKKLKKHSLHCHCIGGDLRNLDVLLHWAKQNPDLISPKLFHALKKKREILQKSFFKKLIYGNALQKLQTRGRDFIARIKELNKENFEPHIHHYIEKNIQDFNRLLPTANQNLDQLHQMRKILKKIRYSLHLLPTVNLEHQQELKEIQDMLGYINDRRVWINLLTSHFKNKKEVVALIAIFEAEMYKKIDIYNAHMLNEVDNSIGYFMKR